MLKYTFKASLKLNCNQCNGFCSVLLIYSSANFVVVVIFQVGKRAISANDNVKIKNKDENINRHAVREREVIKGFCEK